MNTIELNAMKIESIHNNKGFKPLVFENGNYITHEEMRKKHPSFGQATSLPMQAEPRTNKGRPHRVAPTFASFIIHNS
jgi:hypothetical protein